MSIPAQFKNTIIVLAISVLLWPIAVVHAQEPESELQQLPAEIVTAFETAIQNNDLQQADIADLDERVTEVEGVAADILNTRRDRIWSAMFSDTISFARQVATQRDKGFDVSAFVGPLVQELEAIPDEAGVAIERIKARGIFPTGDLPPNEFVVQDQQLFQAIDELDVIYRALISYIEVAGLFELDASTEVEFLDDALQDAAANRSIFLERSLADVKTLRAATAALPNDTDLAAWLSAAQTRVQLTAKSLQVAINLMNAVDLETRQYRQQVLTVTGEITTDIFDVGIVANLAREWGDALWSLAAQDGPRLMFRLILVALIILAFYQLSKLVQKGVEKAMKSSRNRMSHLLQRMIISSVRNLIMIFGILIGISQLGISLAPLLAGLGIAGFIIGFALQDSLSNFASGVMILMYRPFDVGDVVDAAGVRGRVSSMSLVNTTFMTLDNQRLVVPNNMIWQSVITNVTAQRTRRVDLIFGISYGDDIEKAEKILHQIIEDSETCLDDPEPVVAVHELGESSVNFVVRPWVRTTDYWDTYWALTKEVKLRFDREGVSIPFPQRDVHVIEQKS